MSSFSGVDTYRIFKDIDHDDIFNDNFGLSESTAYREETINSVSPSNSFYQGKELEFGRPIFDLELDTVFGSNTVFGSDIDFGEIKTNRQLPIQENRAEDNQGDTNMTGYDYMGGFSNCVNCNRELTGLYEMTCSLECYSQFEHRYFPTRGVFEEFQKNVQCFQCSQCTSMDYSNFCEICTKSLNCRTCGNSGFEEYSNRENNSNRMGYCSVDCRDKMFVQFQSDLI